MKTQKPIFKLSALCLSMASILMTGCSSSSDEPALITTNDSNQSERITEVQINASSYDATVYFNILTGQTVTLTDEEASSSSAWHLGLKRTGIKLNGGDSGPGNVAGALSDSQDELYPSGVADAQAFENLTRESEEEALLNPNLTALNYIEDTIQAGISGSGETVGSELDMGWYFYHLINHGTVRANDDNWWLIKSSAGDSYAKFYASSADISNGNLDVTFEFDVQAKDTLQYAGTATFEASVPTSGGSECFDFDTNTVVDCTSADWDLQLEIAGRSFNLWTSGGDVGTGSGGSFGPFSTADANEYTAGHVATDGTTSIARHYSADTSQGVFSENAWYGYHLNDTLPRLAPNFRTYVIDTDATDNNSVKYAFQVVSYYQDGEKTGSGYPTIRFAQVAED